MLSHLRETAASFPGLAQIDWGHLDNQGLHAAVSAIVRVHTALQASGVNTQEALQVQQQLAALYTAAGKSGATGLSEEQLETLPTCECDKQRLFSLASHPTCAICHEDYTIGQTLRKLPAAATPTTRRASATGSGSRPRAPCAISALRRSSAASASEEAFFQMRRGIKARMRRDRDWT